MLPDTEYTPEEQEKLLDRIADQVVRRRLEMPAALFLEMHRPLRFFAGQGLLFMSPVLGAFFGVEQIYKFSRLVEDPATVDRLMQRIEEKSQERRVLGCWGVEVLGGSDAVDPAPAPKTPTSDPNTSTPQHPNT